MAQADRPPLVLQLLFLGKLVGYLLEQRLASRGLNRTQTMILITLARHPGLRALDLAAPATVEPANVTRTLQSLERLELIERRSHPSDGRGSLFYLTEPGVKLAGELSEEVERLSSELFDALEPEELLPLEKALGSLWKSLHGHLAGIARPPSALTRRPPASRDDEAVQEQGEVSAS